MTRAFELLLIVILTLCLEKAPAVETDILDIARRHPLHVLVGGKPARFGDPELAEAVDALADLPHPWLVPIIIELFQRESQEWLAKLAKQRSEGNDQLWEGWRKAEKHCGYLATILAASRDPRAAVALGHAFDGPPEFPGRFRVITGLNFYFLSDPRYRRLPSREAEASTNLFFEWTRDVRQWWLLNKTDLETSAKDYSP